MDIILWKLIRSRVGASYHRLRRRGGGRITDPDDGGGETRDPTTDPDVSRQFRDFLQFFKTILRTYNIVKFF